MILLFEFIYDGDPFGEGGGGGIRKAKNVGMLTQQLIACMPTLIKKGVAKLLM
jgi:hypothetical protein